MPYTTRNGTIKYLDVEMVVEAVAEENRDQFLGKSAGIRQIFSPKQADRDLDSLLALKNVKARATS